MMNAGNQKGKTRQTSDWRRRMIAFVSALTLLISSCGLTAFAESDEDIYSDPVTAPIPAANTSPEPEEGEAQATPAPEGQPETGTEPQEATGEETETEGEPEVSEEPEDLTVYESGTLTAEADGIGITVDYTAEARVPEGTVLTLTRAAGGDLYSALKSASKVLKTEENATWKRELGEDAVFYAITLTNPEGNEVHPETGVTLTCTNLEIPADATGFVTGDNAENLDWKDTLTVGFLPDAIGYAYLKQVQIGTVTLTHEDRDYMVTAAYGPDAGFPADTELKVREILPGTPEYALYSGMTDEALNEDWAEITLERYFDIAFVANGEEMEPKADVDVQIVFRDKIEQNEETEVAAVHIENNEANVIEAETDSTKSARHDNEAIDTVTFTSDSFSVYGVVQKKKITKKVLAADGKTYDINVSYGPEAEIPEGADLNVREILPEDENFESYLNDAMRAASDESEETPLQTEYARFFDIEIVADGQKVEPKSAVSVSISLTDEQAAEQSDLCVVHFDEEKGAVVLEAEAETASDIQFEAESFSVYGVITYPTAQPQGVADLGGRKFTIKKENYYIASTTRKIGGCERFNGTTNSSETPVWQFESTEKTGEYYISATIGGEKKYLSVRQHAINGTGTVGDAELSSEPKALVIQKTGNGYSISDGSYYLKFYNGHNNHDFIASQGPDSAELTLTFEDTPTVTKGEHYAIIVRSQDGGDCYAVKNDGTLERVIFYPETNSVKMDYPLFWEYTQTDGIHYNLRIPTLASGFNWQNLPSGYYYRYLDPNSDAGITEEENLGVPADKSDNENPEAAAAHQKYINNCAMRPYEDLRIKGYDYYLGIDENNMKVIGRASESEAAIVYFVKAENVLPSERQNHTVNHVDIAIEGGASLSVPLDYGDYFYYVDGVRHDLTVDVSNPITLTLKKDQIGITPDDMKLASITAFSTKTNKVMNDAFYITGYSQNHDTGKTAAQVRIEGSFKVADLEPYNKPENELTYDELQARLNNRVRYTVTVSKKELFQWEYEYEPGKKAQLYSAKTGEALSSNTTVNLSKSFDYWDEDNACPPIKDKLYGVDEEPAWREGHIIWDTSKHNGSGMDFELKATVNMTADTVAIHITKEILKTSGEILHPKTTVNNDFIVYQKKPVTAEDISAVTTVGMGAGSTAADYTGFAGKHTKRISISSTDDSGATTDYDVDRDSMVYIEESAESIPEYITDAEGAKWKYVRTYIETPYAWRQKGDEGKEHVAEGTKSVPEVLGAYGTYVDDNGETQQLFNRVQEFHVHNVYAKVETITAEKLWQDVSGYTLNESEYIAEYPSITLQLYEDGTADPIPGKDQVLNKDNEWKCEWTDLDADKSYYVKEKTALNTEYYEGPIYIVNGKVKDEGTALQYGTVQVVNRKKELKVKLRKCLKGNTKAPVEGAVFEIHHADRYPDNTPLLLKAEGAAEPATSFTSNAEGNFYIGYLPVGTYVIKETGAPSEYTLMDPVEFEILDEEHVDVIQATGVKRYLRYRTWGSTSDGDWQYKSIGDKGYFNLYCEDVPSKTITVTKEWFVNGTETSPSEGSITFDLYRTKQDLSTLETTETINQYTTKTVQLLSTTNSLTNPGNPTCYVGGTVKFRFHDAAGRNWNNTEYIYNGKFTRSDKTEYDSNSGIWSYTSPLSELYVEIPIKNADSLTVDTYEQGFKVDFIESLPPEAESSGETAATTSALPGTRADLSAITEKELVGNYTISASSSPAWTYDSGNTLEKYDYSGATPVEWTYFAIERSVSGYTDTYEYDSDGNITIKNSRTYTPEGSLKITKVVTVNDAADISTITNGTYSFSVSSVAGTPTAGITHTVSVTFANGKATSYQIDSNEAVTVTGTDNTWSVVLTNLTPGDYTITETSSGPLALKSITGGKIGTVNLADKSVVATVTDEDYTPTTEAAQVVFTNNIRTVTVAKAWKDLNGDTASWPQDEEDNYTPEYVTVKLQRRTAGTSDEYVDVAGIATQNIYPENLNDQPTTATFLIPEDEYEYRVVEVNVPAGFVADVAEIEGTGSYTITNRKVPTIDIEATKRWLNTDVANQAAAVRFELYIAGNDTPIENSERIIVRDSGITTTESENIICTWTEKAEWLKMPQYVDDTADLRVPVEYEVRETGVYYGDLDNGTVPSGVVWANPNIPLTVTGGEVNYNNETEKYEAIITNAFKCIDVPVIKSWANYDTDDKFSWTAEFVLEMREELEPPQTTGTSEAQTTWIPVNSIHNKIISKGDTGDAITFKHLPMYHVHANGSIYRIIYSVDEIAYSVTENDKVIARWNRDDGTSNIATDGDYYSAEFDQYAGSDEELRGSADWYKIILHNMINHDTPKEYVDINIHKDWDNSEGTVTLTDSSYAEFKLMRYVSEGFVDYSQVAAGETENVTVTMNVNGTDQSIEVPKGAFIRITGYAEAGKNAYFAYKINNGGEARANLDNTKSNAAIMISSSNIKADQNIQITIASKDGVSDLSLTDITDQREPAPDGKWTPVVFRLNNGNNWDASFPDLIQKSVTTTSTGDKKYNIYSYYFEEISSDPAGFYAEYTKNSDNTLLGDVSNRISENTIIKATNKVKKPFRVTKLWQALLNSDLEAYPEIAFTLYQVPEGRDYVSANDVYRPGGPHDNSFVNIKLNYGNNWTWDCPVQLPETYQQDGQTKYWNYYVIETPKDAGQTVSGVVWTNPAYDAISTSQGSGNDNLQINVEGYRCRDTLDGEWTTGLGHGGYTTQTPGGDAITTIDHTKYDQPYNAAIRNTGEIQIINKTIKYMQMDLKKKFLRVVRNSSNNGWNLETWTQEARVKHDLVIEIQVKRRIVEYDSFIPLNNGVPVGGADYQVVQDWTNYGLPVLIGYGPGTDSQAGTPISENPASNPFKFRYAADGDWHWTIDNEFQDKGLPAYGLYKDPTTGVTRRVRYQYILVETNAFSDLDRNNPRFWYNVLPAAWDGAGFEVELFPKVVAQDQDRLVNVENTEINIKKEWNGTSGADAVYVKIWRKVNGGDFTDYTNTLQTSISQLWQNKRDGLVNTDDLKIVQENGVTEYYLIIPTNGGEVTIRNALPYDCYHYYSGYEDAIYYYKVQECGYQLNGQDYWDVTPFDPEYGFGSNAVVLPQGGNTIALDVGDPSRNVLKIINTVTADITVEKKWELNGTLQNNPWTVGEDTVTSVEFSVTRVGTQYTRSSAADAWRATGTTSSEALSFTNGAVTENVLRIVAGGKQAKLRINPVNDKNYTVTYEDYSGSWKTFVSGLQLENVVSETEKWVYTYQIAETAIKASHTNEDQTVSEISIDASEYTTEYSVTASDGVLGDEETSVILNNHGTATVTNSRTLKGALSITKQVTVNGESVAVDVLETDGEPETGGESVTDGESVTGTSLADGTYTFTVAGPSPSTTVVKYVQIDVVNGVAVSYRIADTEGGLSTASTVPNGTAVVEDLTPGDYTITEEATDNGTTLSGRSGGTKVEERGILLTVEAGCEASAAIATFTNNKPYITYSPKVTKTLTGREWKEGDSFTFTLATTSTSGMTMPVNNTVTISYADDIKTKAFDEVAFTAEDTYTFTITETVPDDASNGTVTWHDASDEQKAAGGFEKDGVTYDGSAHTLTVTVEETSGVLSITHINNEAVADQPAIEAVSTTVTNTYDTSTTAHIEGTKVFTNGTIGENQFSFTVTANDNNTPLPEVTSVYADTNGDIVFGDITYPLNLLDEVEAEEGVKTKVFTYTVKEDLPSGVNPIDADKTAGYIIVNGIKYDLTEKTVTITVMYTESSGEMTASVSPEKVGLEFTNVQYGSVQVKKAFSGIDALPDGFKITANWTIDSQEYSVELTTSTTDSIVEGTGYTVSEVSGDGNTIPYTWTIGNLPIGTEVTFTEDAEGCRVDGYIWSSTVSVNDNEATSGISGTATVDADEIKYVTITNTYVAGVELPSTGGSGTLIYTITGIFLITLAGTLLVARKRKVNR